MKFLKKMLNPGRVIGVLLVVLLVGYFGGELDNPTWLISLFVASILISSVFDLIEFVVGLKKTQGTEVKGDAKHGNSEQDF